MIRRIAAVLIALSLTLSCFAKDKKKNSLPDLILRAQYVAVIEDPDTGVSLTDPGGNRIAERDVEAALERWGRLKITTRGSAPDLLIVVRRASKPGSPTIGGGTRNDGPVVMDPSGNGDLRIGGSTGRPPRDSDATWGRDEGPTPRAEIGPSEDMFSVYDGRASNSLDGAPLWRYAGHGALQHPGVPAVEKFRKAIEDSEKGKP